MKLFDPVLCKHRQEILEKALRSLPKSMRTIVEDIVLNELPPSAVAQRLGLSKDKVSNRLVVALSFLYGKYTKLSRSARVELSSSKNEHWPASHVSHFGRVEAYLKASQLFEEFGQTRRAIQMLLRAKKAADEKKGAVVSTPASLIDAGNTFLSLAKEHAVYSELFFLYAKSCFDDARMVAELAGDQRMIRDALAKLTSVQISINNPKTT